MQSEHFVSEFGKPCFLKLKCILINTLESSLFDIKHELPTTRFIFSTFRSAVDSVYSLHLLLRGRFVTASLLTAEIRLHLLQL
jgi:hypothetical protein